MSDTSNSELTYSGSGITFDPDLAPRDGEPTLNEDEAADLLMRRFGISRPRSAGAQFWNTIGQGLDAINPLSRQAEGDNNRIRDDLETDPTGRDLIVHIVRALPQEALTESVLLNVDIRPILADLILTEVQAQRNPSAIRYVNDVPFAAKERVLAGELLVQENQTVEELAIVAAAAKEKAGEFGEAGTEEARNARRDWILQQTEGWRNRTGDGRLGATPALAVEQAQAETLDEQEAITEQVQSQSLYEQQLAAAELAEVQNAYNFMTEEQMQWMFQMDMVQWNDLLLNERNKKEARAAGVGGIPGDFMVDTGGLAGIAEAGGTERMDLPGGIRDVTTRGSTKVRLLDVFNSLFSSDRTTRDLRNVQDKLIAGGYLDEDDVRYWGMATDDATKQAWRTLVRDSVNMGKDMNSVLLEATKQKRIKDEENEKASQRDLVLSSSAGIQTSADAIGQSVLGRRLSSSDHARLIEFVHSLEREQHDTLAPEGMQETEAIDIDAEIERYLYGEHGAEAGAYDLLEQVNVFTDFVRRPG